MNKKTKRGIILTSLASIAFAGSLLAGSTYALFTSESTTNIAVTSGKVDVSASISGLTLHSPTSVSDEDGGKIEDDTEAANDTTFKNNGTASLVGNKLTLSCITPGDYVTFNINITNNCTVSAKYRTLIACEDNDGLFDGLECTIGNEISSDGLTIVSDWKELSAGASISPLACKIELPVTATNKYQGKSCEISFTVEAVQGNAVTTDKADGTYELYTASDLKWFQKNCNTQSINTTVKLMRDIDLNGEEWAPINWGLASGNQPRVFDGNNHTISNFTATSNKEKKFSDNGADKNKDIGLFGSVVSTTIQNLKIDSATISGHGRVGAILGYGQASSIKNCTVTNSTITASPWNTGSELDDGDKAGAVVGSLSEGSKELSGCYVENCTISGYRDLGGVAGYVNANCTIKDNNVNNAEGATSSTVIKYNDTWPDYGTNPKRHSGENVDYIVGSKNGQTIDETTNNKYSSKLTSIVKDTNLQASSN